MCTACGGYPQALWCFYCAQPKPEHVEHCHTCNRCVAGFDHHCDLIDSCIGQSNYPAFLGLLGASVAASATGCACTVVYVIDGLRHVSFASSSSSRAWLSLALVAIGAMRVSCQLWSVQRACARGGADWFDVLDELRMLCAEPSRLLTHGWGTIALLGGLGRLAIVRLRSGRLPPGYEVSPLLPLQMIAAAVVGQLTLCAATPFALFHVENVWRATSTKRRWQRRRAARGDDERRRRRGGEAP